MTGHRDVTEPYGARARAASNGQSYIAVIGIDRYQAWSRLDNAVSDARGAMDVFLKLGFVLARPPLFDDQATGDALHRLVTSDLTKLRKQDSLVVFFAGHGHTVTRTFLGGASVKDGYLIPADGGPHGRRTGSWIRLESWLKDITRLPAHHILVILDACHSGLALGSIIRSRQRGAVTAAATLDRLRARRSRRIITSALDDQVATDSGPLPGHSLFTGCLIDALNRELRSATDATLVTASQIGLHVQRRVTQYRGSLQTPDFGTLELDDRGELVICLPKDPRRTLSGPLDQVADTSQPDAAASIPGIPKQVVDAPAGPHHAQADAPSRSMIRSIAIAGADVCANIQLTGILCLIAIAVAMLIPGLGTSDDAAFVFSDDVWPARRASTAAGAPAASDPVVTESISLEPHADPAERARRSLPLAGK